MNFADRVVNQHRGPVATVLLPFIPVVLMVLPLDAAQGACDEPEPTTEPTTEPATEPVINAAIRGADDFG